MGGGRRDSLPLKVLEKNLERLCPSALHYWLGGSPWARGTASPGSGSPKGESFSPNACLAWLNWKLTGLGTACPRLAAGWRASALHSSILCAGLRVWAGARVGTCASVSIWSEAPLLLHPLPSHNLHQMWKEAESRGDLIPGATPLHHGSQHGKVVHPDYRMKSYHGDSQRSCSNCLANP